MRTKVRFTIDQGNAKKGDYGFIDGYIGTSSSYQAIVIVNKHFLVVPLFALEILDDATIIPIPSSDKFPTSKEYHEMAENYDLLPGMQSGFYAAISWVHEWMRERNLL